MVKFKIQAILNYILRSLKIKKTVIYENNFSPDFPLLKNDLLLKEIKKYKFENFYHSLDKTIKYLNK